MRKLTLALPTALLALTALLSVPATAQAAEPLPPVKYSQPTILGVKAATSAELADAYPIYGGMRWSDSQQAAGICVENKLSSLTQGGEPYDSGVLWAVLEWRANGAPYLYYRADNGCDHLPWDQKIIIRGIWDNTLNWCGNAAITVYSGAPRIIYKVDIRINLTASFPGCHGNRQRRYHVQTHELGHGAGTLADLSTPQHSGWGNSVMDYSTNYRTQPTSLDAYRMNWVASNGGGW